MATHRHPQPCDGRLGRAEASGEFRLRQLRRPGGHEPAPRLPVLHGRQHGHAHPCRPERAKARPSAFNAHAATSNSTTDGAEFDYQPRACTRPYRVVVRRKNVSKMKGEHMLVEGIRIFWVGLQRTNNMRRYTASSPISKRYTYTPIDGLPPTLKWLSLQPLRRANDLAEGSLPCGRHLGGD